jgi:nitrogen fixation NifU-like protein
MDDLYRDFILEHYKRPRNFGEQIKVADGKIADLRFNGHGCAISQAAASIATEELIGMDVEEAAKLDADWMLALLGIDISATRRKCALLLLKALRHAITGDGSWPVGATD